MIIDIHTHIWGNRIEDCRQKILTAIQRYGIDRVYVSGLQTFYSDEAEIDHLTGAVAQFMHDEPELIGGAVYVNPRNNNTLDVIRQAIEDRGFEMIKLWVSTLADDPCVDPILEYSENTGVPVMMHAILDSIQQMPTCSTGVHIANIARRHPKAKILMAHFGGSCYHGIPCIRDLPNVWCDQSGPTFHGEELTYAVEQLGAERVLFGTDMPGPYIVNLGQVQGAGFTPAQEEQILWKNAQTLLDQGFRL